METTTGGLLPRFEKQLRMVRGRRAVSTLECWRKALPLLAEADLRAPAEVPKWVWSLRGGKADAVVRALIGLAQEGDEVAVLVVVACLRPGLASLAARFGLPLDDVVGELPGMIFEYPLERRSVVAAGLLLDARHRFWAAHQRRLAEGMDGVVDDLEGIAAPVDRPWQPLTAAECLLDLVCDALRAGSLDEDDARLVVETRLQGDPMDAAAQRRGLRKTAAYKRRQRAEAQLGDRLVA